MIGYAIGKGVGRCLALSQASEAAIWIVADGGAIEGHGAEGGAGIDADEGYAVPGVEAPSSFDEQGRGSDGERVNASVVNTSAPATVRRCGRLR